jgi:hypothetical protein
MKKIIDLIKSLLGKGTIQEKIVQIEEVEIEVKNEIEKVKKVKEKVKKTPIKNAEVKKPSTKKLETKKPVTKKK